MTLLVGTPSSPRNGFAVVAGGRTAIVSRTRCSVQRCFAEPGPVCKAVEARWTPDQQRTTPQARRVAQHPGNADSAVGWAPRSCPGRDAACNAASQSRDLFVRPRSKMDPGSAAHHAASAARCAASGERGQRIVGRIGRRRNPPLRWLSADYADANPPYRAIWKQAGLLRRFAPRNDGR